MSKHTRAALSLVEDAPDRTRQLLTDGWQDEHSGEHQPGLVELYPTVVEWTTVRSVGTGGGSGKSAPLPFNAEALDFLGGSYWADPDRPMPIAKTDRDVADLADPLNYRPGFEPTVLGLEASARRALDFGPAPRHAHAALESKPGVLAALHWLADAMPALRERAPLLADGIHENALRLLLRARLMTLGARITAGRNQCQHCFQVESVVADEQRAFCMNPLCRTADGQRHCWWNDPEAGWVAVDEPDLRGRGQVSDDQLSRWSETA